MRINETDLASTIIRNEIDAYDRAMEKAEEERIQATTFTDGLDQVQVPSAEFVRVVFGSKRPSMTFASLEERGRTDLAFQNIRTKINRALSRILGTTQRISLTAEQEVSNISILLELQEFSQH